MLDRHKCDMMEVRNCDSGYRKIKEFEYSIAEIRLYYI